MKFGVIIRSIEERTEKLCYDSVIQCIPAEHVHILRNYYPSYKTYLKMFKIAKAMKYDWYLGLDADVVLKKDWIDLLDKKLKVLKEENIFRFHFHVKDYHSQKKLLRGNHFYNGKYTEFCSKFLLKNIKIGRYWFYYKNKGYSSGYFTKPESSIRTQMKNVLNISDAAFPEVIGWHGYEQYYLEVFRQYITRRQRDPDFFNDGENEYLAFSNQNKLLESHDIDRYIANIAWNITDNWRIKAVDGRIRNKIKLFLEKYNIKEKEALFLSLEDFYKKWSL